MKRGTAGRSILGPLPTTMCSDDRAADREAEAKAALLGGREWLKEMVRDLRRDAASGILDGDLHRLVCVGSGNDDEGPLARRRVLHGFAGIHDEVEYHLLELDPIAVDDPHPASELPCDRNLMRDEVALRKIEHFGHDQVDVERLENRLALPKQVAQAMDDVAGALG